MPYPQTLEVFQSLRPGDRIEVVHEVKVGFRRWTCTTLGRVLETDRVRRGLHYDRNFDDPVFSDQILLRRDDGELTTVTLDEFSQLRRLSA